MTWTKRGDPKGSRLRSRCAAGALVLVAANATTPGDAEQAREALRQTVQAGLDILSTEGLDDAAKRARIEALAEERFDFEVMARLVLARSWRKFSPEQRKEFVQEFKHHLSATYGRRLQSFDNETVEFGPVHVEANGDVTGETTVRGGAAGDGTSLRYRMRKRADEWYVIDVVIEGVSLLQNFRAQISEMLRTSTPDELIQRLREKNEAHAGEA